MTSCEEWEDFLKKAHTPKEDKSLKYILLHQNINPFVHQKTHIIRRQSTVWEKILHCLKLTKDYVQIL